MVAANVEAGSYRPGVRTIEWLKTPGWTDENRHDPGITILEALAYTLIAAAGATAFARWRTRRNAHHRDTTG